MAQAVETQVLLGHLRDLAPVWAQVQAMWGMDLDPDLTWWRSFLRDESVALTSSLPPDHPVVGVRISLGRCYYGRPGAYRPLLTVTYRGVERNYTNLLPRFFNLENFLGSQAPKTSELTEVEVLMLDLESLRPHWGWLRAKYGGAAPSDELGGQLQVAAQKILQVLRPGHRVKSFRVTTGGCSREGVVWRFLELDLVLRASPSALAVVQPFILKHFGPSRSIRVEGSTSNGWNDDPLED